MIKHINLTSGYNHRLDENIHGPVDIYISSSIYKILPFIVKHKISSTHIYIVSLIFSFLTTFLIEKNIKYIPGISLMLSYYFNVMYFIYVEYEKNKDINIISFQETTLNIFTIMFLLNSLYKKDLHKYIIVTILFIGLLCNFGCQIQYFKQKYPHEKTPFIFSKILGLTCPLGSCEETFKSQNIKIPPMLNKYSDNILSFERTIFSIEKIKNKIHTKYIGPGTVFLVISLYLAFM